jgi:hypothetical protein
MDIAFQLPLEPAERVKLASVIGCTDQDLDQTFCAFSKAAADEYVQMFLGKNAFRRTSDFQDFRILLLIIHVLNGSIPDEALVSRLFQTSSSESRARIRSVTSKYQRALEQQIKGSIRVILTAATPGAENTHIITVNNQAIVDLLNAKLAEINGSHSQVAKVRGTVASFSLAEASYDDLTAYYA